MNKIQKGAATPLGLEVYSVEATRPMKLQDGTSYTSTDYCTTCSVKNYGEPPHSTYLACDVGYEGDNDYSSSGSPRTVTWRTVDWGTSYIANGTEAFEAVSPLNTAESSELLDGEVHERILLRESDIRSTFNLEMALAPLKVEFRLWDPIRYSKEVSDYCSISSETRLFLSITKTVRKHIVYLHFQLEDSTSAPFPEEGKMRISLINWKVNALVFDNLSFNRFNYDDSRDILTDMVFLTASEFILVIRFILKGLDRRDPCLNSEVNRNLPVFLACNDPFLPNRVRSNVREFLKGKLLRESVPKDLADKLLPSQIDYMVGLFEQISKYQVDKPARKGAKLYVMKVTDFEKAVKKCMSFYFFALPSEHN